MKRICTITLITLMILSTMVVNASETSSSTNISDDGHTIAITYDNDVVNKEQLEDAATKSIADLSSSTGFGGMFDIKESDLEVSYTRSGVQNFSKTFNYYDGSDVILKVKITTAAWVDGSNGYLLSTTGTITEVSPFVSAYFAEMYYNYGNIVHRCTVHSSYMGMSGDEMYYSTYQVSGTVTITRYD